MIYTPHEAISRRADEKGRKPRPTAENADRDDLSRCVKPVAKRAPIGHKMPCFALPPHGLRRLEPRVFSENLTARRSIARAARGAI
jgi:hypothetical protein